MSINEAVRVEIDVAILEDALRTLRSEMGAKIPQRIMQRTLAAVAKDVRKVTQSWAAPPRVRRAAAKTVGWSAKRGKYVVGYGAGRRKKTVRPAGKPGVGISKENVHWFVLGTQMRRTSKGLKRGRLEAYLKGALAQGTAKLLEYFNRFAEEEITKHTRRMLLRR